MALAQDLHDLFDRAAEVLSTAAGSWVSFAELVRHLLHLDWTNSIHIQRKCMLHRHKYTRIYYKLTPSEFTSNTIDYDNRRNVILISYA